MTTSLRSFAALIALTLLPLSVGGAARAQASPGYTAVVTEQHVDVRSGGGRAYYVVGELEAGQQVQVIEALFDETWYKIRVPETVYSYVSKAFVDAQGDGSTGVINTDRTEFKAASLRGPGESYRVQGTFSAGDRVTIIAEEGNFYKITSPAGSCVFIPAGSIRQATAQDTAPAVPAVEEVPAQPLIETDHTEAPAIVEQADSDTAIEEEAVSTAPVVEPAADAADAVSDLTEHPDAAEQATDPETVTTEALLPPRPEVEVETPARSEALKAREMELLPYFAIAIENRPLDYIEEGYRDILANGNLPRVDQRIVQVRLRTIARQREILAAITRAQAISSGSHEPETEIPDLEALPSGPVDYQAVGLLQTSSVYDGHSLPRMYRVVDPSGRTLAYIAPTPLIDASDLLGTLVGVVGSTTYDPALKLQIVTPERLDALTTQP